MSTIAELEAELAALKTEGEELKAEVEAFDRLVQTQSRILTETVNWLKGPPPELTTWSHHDIAELARQTVQRLNERSEWNMRISYIILWGAAGRGCNWATDGSVSSHQRIYDETLRLVAEKAFAEGRDVSADAPNPYSR